MNAGATADRVYDTLKRHVLSGAVLPGEKLDPTRIAEDLNSSATPVRDALHRLIGERLVETRHGEGFYLPMTTESGLRDLYVWNAQLLRLLVLNWPRDAGARMSTPIPVDPDQATIALFDLVAARTGNDEFVKQLEAMHDRLATARVAEHSVLDGLGLEVRAMAVVIDHDTPARIVGQLLAYHRRRLRAVPGIARAIYHPH